MKFFYLLKTNKFIMFDCSFIKFDNEIYNNIKYDKGNNSQKNFSSMIIGLLCMDMIFIIISYNLEHFKNALER